MPYTVPVGNDVELKFLLESYVAPLGDAVDLRLGLVDLAYGQVTLSGSAVGACPALATGSVVFSGSAAAGCNPAISYSLQASPLQFAVSASGEALPAALANDQVRLSGSASGTSAENGDASGSIPWSGAADGAVRFSGYASGQKAFSGAGYGNISGVFDRALGELVFSGSGSGAGSVTPPRYATATGPILFSGSGEITLSRVASGTGRARFSGSAASFIGRTGAASGKVPFVVSAAGKGRGIGSVGSGGIQFSCSGYGLRGVTASASVVAIFSGASSGSHIAPTTAAGSGDVVLLGDAFGDFILHPEGIPGNMVFVSSGVQSVVVTNHV